MNNYEPVRHYKNALHVEQMKVQNVSLGLQTNICIVHSSACIRIFIKATPLVIKKYEVFENNIKENTKLIHAQNTYIRRHAIGAIRV